MKLLILLGLSTLCLGQTAEVGVLEPEVQLLGLQIISEQTVGQDATSQHHALRAETGTTLSLKVSAPGQTFIGIDPTRCQVGAHTDDLKGNIRMGAKGGFQLQTLGDQGTTMLINIRCPGTPKPGSKTMTFTGRVRATTAGTSQANLQQKLSELQPRSTLRAGTVTYTFQGIEPSQFLDAEDATTNDFTKAGSFIDVSLETRDPEDAIKEIVFLKADGSVIKHRRFMRIHPISNARIHTFTIPETAKDATISITYLDDIQTYDLPLQFTYDHSLKITPML